jgi:hypothetical protein
LLSIGENTSKNLKSQRLKNKLKGLRRLKKSMQEPRGRKKLEDNQELNMALFQEDFPGIGDGRCLGIFPEEFLEWDRACLE